MHYLFQSGIGEVSGCWDAARSCKRFKGQQAMIARQVPAPASRWMMIVKDYLVGCVATRFPACR